MKERNLLAVLGSYLEELKNLGLRPPYRIGFNDFAYFVLTRLQFQHHDTRKDLEIDLKILSNLQIISYDEENKEIFIGYKHLKNLKTILEKEDQLFKDRAKKFQLLPVALTKT